MIRAPRRAGPLWTSAPIAHAIVLILLPPFPHAAAIDQRAAPKPT